MLKSCRTPPTRYSNDTVSGKAGVIQRADQMQIQVAVTVCATAAAFCTVATSGNCQQHRGESMPVEPAASALVETARRFVVAVARGDTSAMRFYVVNEKPLASVRQLSVTYKRLFRDTLGVVTFSRANLSRTARGQATVAVGFRSKALPAHCRPKNSGDILVFDFELARSRWLLSDVYYEFC
jgi:hypothetical protein